MTELNHFSDLSIEVQETFKEFESYFNPIQQPYRGFRLHFKNGDKAISVFSEWNDVDDFEIMNLNAETFCFYGEVVRTDMEEGFEIIRKRLGL